MKKKLLITSVGSLVGQNVLDSLDNRRDNLRIIGTNSIAEAANNFRCDKCYLISKTAKIEDYKSELIAIIEGEQPDLVIPGRDEEVVVLAQLAISFPKYKDKFLTGSESFAYCLDDKVRSYQFALKYNLSFVSTIQSGTANSKEEAETLIAEFGFPLIAKPKKGNGSRGIWIVLNKTQLNNIIIVPDFAIQPLLGQTSDFKFDMKFGLPMFWEIPETRLFASQVIIDKSGKINSIIGFVAKMVNGKCERMERCDDSKLTDVAMVFAKAAVVEGWRGLLNIQLKEDPKHGLQAIELNGRFSGGTSGRYYFGFDEVGIVLREWIGESVIPVKKLPQGVNVVTKILADYEIKESHVDILRQNRVWCTN